ncbi:MAG: Lrp/AsnC family transcriptional regulator [Thermoprotei archaeon]|nr:MAG: Lrp/AsnC family transcriptional regulator [Thermoprotei archaeon]
MSIKRGFREIILLGVVMLSSGDDADFKLISSIARNCRVNLTSVARETGYSYTSLRDRIERLRSRGLLDIKPIIAAKLSGQVAALIRIRTRNPERLIELLSGCNRVLGLMKTGDEIIAMVYGRDKIEVLNIISRLSLVGDGLEEYRVEYGSLPQNFMVLIRRSKPCIHRCFDKDTGCLPVLRLKGNGVNNNYFKP